MEHLLWDKDNIYYCYCPIIFVILAYKFCILDVAFYSFFFQFSIISIRIKKSKENTSQELIMLYLKK